jgi:hypothetical protein
MMGYQGVVKDRLTNKVIYRSRPSFLWGPAQAKAERRAKALGCGDRFEVFVDVAEIRGIK